MRVSDPENFKIWWWIGFLFFRIQKISRPAVLQNPKIEAVGRGVSMSGFERLDRGARGGAPEGERNGNYRHGARTKEMIEVWKLIKSLR